MKKLIIPAMLLASCGAAAGESEIAHRHLAQKIAEYGVAIERCEKVLTDRPLPPTEVLDKLAALDDDAAHQFLVTASAMAQRNCEKPELLELAYTMGQLERADLSQQTREMLENTRPLVFGAGSWELQRSYLLIPDDVKDPLMSSGYFDEPFDDQAIMSELEKR
ncbi:MAG: hypothetical protein CL583_07330 [Alteromonadaceae bacterium]|nr:hypothetical protein [Alteromonadaceae bacterium]